MLQEEFNYNLFCLNLMGQSAKSGFIFICRNTNCKLMTKLFGKLLLYPGGGLIVNLCI